MSGKHSHRRFNPLTEDWVLVSEGRTNRPWLGQVEPTAKQPAGKKYDENCHLCPGNTRITGYTNSYYEGIYVFENDFPALAKTNATEIDARSDEPIFFRSHPEAGCCQVVCFSDNHSLTLAQMSTEQIESVVLCFQEQTDSLLSQSDINHVQIFENRGAAMGCSNPHPHAQIWAQSTVPTIPAREWQSMSTYADIHKTTLLVDYCSAESNSEERVVCENDYFVAVVPYWASWPFEVLLLPRQHRSIVTELNNDEVTAFADLLRRITVRYDNLFQTSFPYSAGIHQMPGKLIGDNSFDFHMHFYPPLLRSATVKKFMVGYEMLAEAQRDISPEQAALLLRELPEEHYSVRAG